MLIAAIAAKTGLPQLAVKLIGGALAVGLALLAFNLWLDDQKDDAVEADRREANEQVLKTDSAAKVEAANQRADDNARISEDERKRHDAINSEAAGKPSAASIRHNCERLRRAGKDTSRIAACAGLGN